MFRFAMVALLMTAGLAGSVSASAQQLTEQQANQVAQGSVDAFNAAYTAKDAGAIAARYTEDCIRVAGSGDTLVGRAAIEAFYKKSMQVYDNDDSKLDRVKIVSDNVIVAFGLWSGTFHSDKGPVRSGGHWMNTMVRTADGWKIAAALNNVVPQK
jgi:uncharacterized protein (TIGR02246 family)